MSIDVMRARVIHLIGGRFDGMDMLFYGMAPDRIAMGALDRLANQSGTLHEYNREYEYAKRSTMRHDGYTEYKYNCVSEHERVENDVAG